MKKILIVMALGMMVLPSWGQESANPICWDKEYLSGSNQRFGDVFVTFFKNGNYAARNTMGYKVDGKYEKDANNVWFTWTNGNVTKIRTPKC